ncbi:MULTISPECIES: hypothetical protein [unclassified Brevundimonas]|uniref:hypothetical protein n=1 Tax=unclassified Brevundimonas TaxID=2622653 RepID=UPI0025BF8403|nr:MULTISPECIES: hypothetical protein [unclassified Brevundimonas]
MRFPTPFAISAALAVSLLAGASATAASAQSGSWKAHMGAGTDNRARDISKSDGEAMVWGRALWHSEGGAIYAGPAFETLNMRFGTGLWRHDRCPPELCWLRLRPAVQLQDIARRRHRL